MSVIFVMNISLVVNFCEILSTCEIFLHGYSSGTPFGPVGGEHYTSFLCIMESLRFVMILLRVNEANEVHISSHK